jgi:hypothetical protein
MGRGDERETIMPRFVFYGARTAHWHPCGAIALSGPLQMEPSQGLVDELQFGENISQFALLGIALKSLERIAGVSSLAR